MNRVLVIAYYTPPLGLSGVIRVTKLCKYLPDFGWEPVIITVKPVAYYGYDPELLGDLKRSLLIRTESLDVNRLLEIVRLRSGGQSQMVPVRSGSRWARLLNFMLLPDAKVGWLPFALEAGRRAITRYQPRVIFATAPPWTALLAGVRLARESGRPLVADFRDPWPAGFPEPPFYQRPLLRQILSRIVKTAAVVLVVNSGTGARLKQVLGDETELGAKLALLENGFDPEELAVAPERLDGFSLVYVGNLYENRQEVSGLVSALSWVPDLKLYLAGDVDPGSSRLLASTGQAMLMGRVSHLRAVALMKGADALLYLGKPEQSVGLKLYEYLGVKRPVIVWGSPDDEAARLVAEFRAGIVCQTGAELAAAVAAIRENPAQFTSQDRQRLDRRFQAERLAEIFERLGSGGSGLPGGNFSQAEKQHPKQR